MNIIIWAAIAAYVLFKLYKVLGYDSEETVQKFKDGKEGKIIDVTPKQPVLQEVEKPPVFVSSFPAEIVTILEKVNNIDQNFTETSFLKGATKAYEMVIKSYSANDNNKLKNLLAPALYDKLTKQIEENRVQGRRIEKILVELSSSNIISAEIVHKDMVLIGVKYISKQINLVKSTDGMEIIEGNPSKLDSIEDVWFFIRSINSRDPAWQIVNIS